jgi:hypothetical protein
LKKSRIKELFRRFCGYTGTELSERPLETGNFSKPVGEGLSGPASLCGALPVVDDESASARRPGQVYASAAYSLLYDIGAKIFVIPEILENVR